MSEEKISIEDALVVVFVCDQLNRQGMTLLDRHITMWRRAAAVVSEAFEELEISSSSKSE